MAHYLGTEKALAYGNFQPNFIQELSQELKGKKVLEIFAGNGYLASLLKKEGVDITSTTKFAGHDGHHIKMFHPVIEKEAIISILEYGSESDVLLASWPTADEAMFYASSLWGSEKDIVFIGEVTVLEENKLGGCASDNFFDNIEIKKEFKTYQGNYLEKALVVKMKD